jgi:hypothetical protein
LLTPHGLAEDEDNLGVAEVTMIFTMRVTDGRCFCDIEIETDKGVEEACSLAMAPATEIERAGDVSCWEAFESSGQAEYLDSLSTEDNRLDVPLEYRCRTERDLLQEVAELKAEIRRLWGAWVRTEDVRSNSPPV